MSPNATPSASAIWKSLALTTALAVALATSPINITSDLGLDESSAFAKSDKSKGKGGSKSKGKSGSKGGSSKGKSGSSNRGGSSASAKSFGGGSDSDGTTQGGKPNRSDWSKQGAAQYKAELAAWKAERGKGKRVASVDGEAKLKNVSNGNPQSLVRKYVLSLQAEGVDVKQGDIASLLKSWNSLNRNEQAFLNNIENPNSLPGKQVAYMSDSFAAGAAMSAAAELAGLEEGFTPEDLEAAAADAVALAAELELSGPPHEATIYDNALGTLAELGAGVTAQNVIEVSEAEANFEGEGVVPTYTVEQVDAARIVMENDDYEAAVAKADAIVSAYGEYQAVETAAASSFYEASVSYSGGYDPETMGALRERVDAIIEMGNFDNVVAEYDAANAEDVVEEEVVAETETTPVE